MLSFANLSNNNTSVIFCFYSSGVVAQHANEVNEPYSDELKPSFNKLNLLQQGKPNTTIVHSLVFLDFVICQPFH
jgi:hypothetical protein